MCCLAARQPTACCPANDATAMHGQSDPHSTHPRMASQRLGSPAFVAAVHPIHISIPEPYRVAVPIGAAMRRPRPSHPHHESISGASSLGDAEGDTEAISKIIQEDQTTQLLPRQLAPYWMQRCTGRTALSLQTSGEARSCTTWVCGAYY